MTTRNTKLVLSLLSITDSHNLQSAEAVVQHKYTKIVLSVLAMKPMSFTK